MRRFVLVLPVLLLLVGCGMTPAERLSLVVTASTQTHEVVFPRWSAACEVKAKTCVAEGVQYAEDCAPWVTCQDSLKKFVEGYALVQWTCGKTALWLSLDEKLKAATTFEKAALALQAMMELARAEGPLDQPE